MVLICQSHPYAILLTGLGCYKNAVPKINANALQNKLQLLHVDARCNTQKHFSIQQFRMIIH